MDKKTSKSHWLVQGDEPPLGLEGLTINNFDEEGFLSYTYNGQSGELELASPSSSLRPLFRRVVPSLRLAQETFPTETLVLVLPPFVLRNQARTQQILQKA